MELERVGDTSLWRGLRSTVPEDRGGGEERRGLSSDMVVELGKREREREGRSDVANDIHVSSDI